MKKRHSTRPGKKPQPPACPLGPALHRYFCQYLIDQRRLSPRTVASYRDTFKLILAFAERRRRRKADELGVEDLDAACVLAFLDDLEKRRGNSARTRNVRPWRRSVHSCDTPPPLIRS